MKTVTAFNIGILGSMDATEVAEKIRNKEISSKEAVECAIERTQATHADLNAMVTDDFSRALQKAEHPLPGIYSGVPTFIKDLNDVEGLPTLKGSVAFKSKPAKKNDAIVDQYLAVTGGVIIGKTSTSEIGLLPCGETLQHGDTSNPWNTEHSTGGSSAGSAALVAAGVVPFAHASDGGGSIRIPASCCGLVGLKPSRGRNIVSPTALVPVDIAQDGLLTRTVRDTANFYAGLEKYYSNPKLPQIGEVNAPNKKRLRIALFTQSSFCLEAQEDVRQTVLDTGKLLESLGHEVEQIKNPFEHSITRDFMLYYSFLSFMSMIAEFARHGFSYNHSRTAKFTKQLGAIFPLLSIKAPHSFSNLRRHKRDYNDLFENQGFDILLSPVLSHTPPPLGHFGTEVDSIDVIMKLNSYVNFTTTQNITGAPAISLPLGLSKDKLPIGVQVAANVGEERKLLELAFELEEAKEFVTLANVTKSTKQPKRARAN